MYYRTCFSFSWSRKHMCASFVLRSIEDWWKPLRDILILFRRDMCKLYEPQEFPRASEESIHSMQYESTSALLLEITFRIIWTRVCFFPNRQICSWFFLETKHHLQKKKPKPLHQNHTSGGRFSTKSVRLGLSPMANFKQISTTFPVMTLRCFHPIPKLHTPPAFRRMKPQFLAFFCGTKMRKNWKQSELPQKEKSMPKVFMVEWKPLESCWIWKPPFILRRTQYNMHWITDFCCQMRISTAHGWDLPQSLFVSDLDSSQCDPTNAGRIPGSRDFGKQQKDVQISIQATM